MPKPILLAKGEPATCNILSLFLRHEGYEAEEVNDASGALQLVETKPFDVVLSAIRMAILDEVAVGTYLRSIAPNTPFIALTAYPESIVRISTIPTALCLIKPILLDQLKTRIQRLIRLMCSRTTY
jgi:CheY-like chemotaxis protein